MKSRFKLIVLHVIIPILFGGMIYIAFRSKSLKMFNWFDIIGLESVIDFVRQNLIPFQNQFPTWFFNSLPDGLWVYAFTSALLIIWNNNFQEVKYWLLFPIVLGAGVEIAQGFRLFTGTFDIVDLLFTILGIIISISYFNLIHIQNEKQN